MKRAIRIGAAVAASCVVVAGCGGGGGASAEAPDPAATAPTANAAPVAVAAVGLGGTVTAGPTTPKPVAKALKGSGVVVVSVLVKGAADDDSVAKAIAEVRSDPRTRSRVAFFTYTVGKGSMGDLADRLGITGTPSVAVIGRDRTLVNLWTGLVDADILRQSISDASDTVAANPGASAVPTSSSLPTGNPAGVALAKKVNAAYGDIAGARITGSVPTAGAGTMTVDATMSFGKGSVAGMSGTFELAGTKFEIVVSSGWARLRSGDAGCWATLPGGTFTDATPAPTVNFTDTRVGAPRAEGDLRLLDVTSGGQTLTYVIDPATNTVSEVRSDAGTVRFEALETAPEIPEATPVCDNPADALQGLPSSLGGTS